MVRLLRLLSLCWFLLASPCEPAQRVVSVNLCTDQLLMLADPAQIASVSYLARDPESSYMARQATAFPINHGRLEELVALQPDLVLAGAYSEPRLLQALARFDIPVQSFPLTNTLSGIEADIRRLAGLLGHIQRGEALIGEMQVKLDRVRTAPDQKHWPKALFYQPRGYTSGSQTLQDEALRLAGWRNLAAEVGVRGYAPLDLETLLLGEPEQLFTSGHTVSAYSRAQQLLQHPALQRLMQNQQPVEVPYKYWFCAGPMLIDAITILHAAHGR